MTQHLSDKQAAFVREYLIDRNATDAYIRAGYKGRSRAAAQAASSRLLCFVMVQKAIEEGTAKQAARQQFKADRAMQELWRIGLFDPGKLYDADGNLKPVRELDDDTRAAIVSVEVEEQKNREGERVSLTKKVKANPKVPALVELLKRLPPPEDTVPPPPPPGAVENPLQVEVAHDVGNSLAPYVEAIQDLLAGRLGAPSAACPPGAHALGEPHG
jgi:phage terminase small subunit